MEEKFVNRDGETYADFAVLTPFGRRLQWLRKLISWTQQPDGTFKAIDVQGPPDFDAWFACFKICRAIMFMLSRKAVTYAALDAYLEAFRVHSLDSSQNAGIYFAQQNTDPAERPSLKAGER